MEGSLGTSLCPYVSSYVHLYVSQYIPMAVCPSICALGPLEVHHCICQAPGVCLYSYLFIGQAVVCGLTVV